MREADSLLAVQHVTSHWSLGHTESVAQAGADTFCRNTEQNADACTSLKFSIKGFMSLTICDNHHHAIYYTHKIFHRDVYRQTFMYYVISI